MAPLRGAEFQPCLSYKHAAPPEQKPKPQRSWCASSTRRYRVSVLSSSHCALCCASSDPTLPRVGTDLIPLRTVIGIVDPTLPRVGTDLIPLRIVIGIVDPTLPRVGTDLIRLRIVIGIVDPTLPRVGTDLIPLRIVLRLVRPDATACRYRPHPTRARGHVSTHPLPRGGTDFFKTAFNTLLERFANAVDLDSQCVPGYSERLRELAAMVYLCLLLFGVIGQDQRPVLAAELLQTRLQTFFRGYFLIVGFWFWRFREVKAL